MLREPTWVPRMDVSETEKAYLISTELPGLKKKDVEISVTGQNLILKGEKKDEKKIKGDNMFRTERSYGSFYRSMMLPPEVEVERISAKIEDGVLEITLPKNKEAQKPSKKIDVEMK